MRSSSTIPIKDFEPITLVASTPYLLVLHPGVKATTSRSSSRSAKSQPGKLNYASAGTGSTTHLAMEMLKSAAGSTSCTCPTTATARQAPPCSAARCRRSSAACRRYCRKRNRASCAPIAVGTAERSPALPDVPTVAESGYPGFEVSLWLGFFAPRGTPIAIINRLHSELARIALSPEMKEQFERNGAEAATNVNVAATLSASVRSEIEKYSKVIKAANIKLE